MNDAIKSYKDLIVWQKSVELAKQAYKLTSQLPKEERYGLASQLQRASVSIASNIAEGYARGTRRDYTQFLRIALGSAFEVNTQLIILKAVYAELQYNNATQLVDEIGKMLQTMIKRLNSKR